MSSTKPTNSAAAGSTAGSSSGLGIHGLMQQIQLVSGTTAGRPIPPQIANLPKLVLERVGIDKLMKQISYFVCPEWATRGSPGTNVEVLKNGARVAVVMVDRSPYVLFGRRAEIVDVHVEHQSTSGVHCCLIHRGEDDSWFLVDLKSVNGTFLNGTRLVPEKFTKIRYDDTFTLGQSTRAYVLKKEHISSKSGRVGGGGAPGSAPTPAPSNSTSSSQPLGHMQPQRVPQTPDAAAAAAPAEVEPAKKRTYHVRHILIKHTESETPVSKNPSNAGEPITRSLQDAIDLAKSLIDSGELQTDFSTVATEFSECGTSKKGGDLGLREEGDFLPEFEEVAFALSVGQVSDAVVTKLGVHIIQRVE